jgi:NADH-quinone oxidoreductase subunit D
MSDPRSTQVSRRLRSAVINFGPQHPASHGVLRLVVQLNGEVVEKIDPHIGFLHRGSEKLMENRNFTQAAVYLDRLDYTSVLTQTHAYCLAVESATAEGALNTNTLLLRTLFDELARMLNHLLAISTHSLDVGSMATLF